MSGPKDKSPINPIAIFGFEADTVGWWGGQGTVSHEGGEGRISYEQAQQLRLDIQHELLPHVQDQQRTSSFTAEPYVIHEVIFGGELAERYDAGLQAGALALADGTLQGRLVSRLTVITHTLAYGWYEDDRSINVADGHIRRKAVALHGLTMAIAVLEGNIPRTI